MRVSRIAVACLGLFVAACTCALGVWQVERRTWKLALIAQVEARIHAAPEPLPPPSTWPGVTAEQDAYRRVKVTGTFDHACETHVQALTELGAGSWVVTPLLTDQGAVLVNRGYVPAERRDSKTREGAQTQGSVTVTGLIRMTEPNGGFLRTNDPAAGRWYSRDVGAIARACHGLVAAPFFIDADATPNPGGFPIGGLTVVSFQNSHLGYAITWFTLAILSLAGTVLMLRAEASR